LAMASETSVRLGTPPDRLWIQKPGIYEDEEGRTWVTVVVRIQESMDILFLKQRFKNYGNGRDGAPSQMPFSQLPPVWQLYPGRKYRAADSSFWEIVDHGQIDSMEQLVLTYQPER
uniref:TCL1 family AKT coactivator B n=1 Tax=Chlorocebus sabaeus TaxID=60711 RepID=A0A0D9RE06_CHLSB